MSCHTTICKPLPTDVAATPADCLVTPDQLMELRAKMALAEISDRDLVTVHQQQHRPIYFIEELTQHEAWEWLTLVEWLIRRTAP